MTKKTRPSFQPDPDQMALMPERSGNDINGRGEADFRRPSPIYWQRPDAIPHGKIQQWMVDRFTAVAAYSDIYAKGDRGPRELKSLAKEQAQDSAQGWSDQVKAFALNNEAELVGIAKLDTAWFYDECEPPTDPWIIVLGIAMDHDKLAQAPSSDEDTASALEVAVQYNRAARAAANLANWIRDQGYQSTPHGGPWAGPMTLIPAALACGFGELGKHGSVINREYGSSFRLSAFLRSRCNFT